MSLYFGRMKLPTARMIVVVTVNLSVTLKANRDSIVGVTWAAIRFLNYMIDLHLYTAPAMADAAAPMTLDQ